ncbi:PLC-like phosphodiesterase [Phyllosticta citriasiana]|uniref:PLC-like phosphodiesterase n=1 Tax=Phyllosticta citriasiana TaxID=595635 RepID=UPI0030FD9181
MSRRPSILTDRSQKAIHSHNDYWQDVPFYKALSYGAMSIEGDVWFINGTLYLGHDTSSLTPQRTLASLYIDPILHVLQCANPPSPYAESLPTFRGVFDRDTEQTLYFVIDFKTKPEIGTLDAVLAALEPLRSAGYLTTWHASNNSIVKGPITAIGTGEMNLASVLSQTPLRDLFYDSPLFNLTFEENRNITGPEVSPLASGHFTEAFGKVTKADFFAQNETALKVLRDQLRVAHDKNVMVRYWEQPGWPIGTRNSIWRTFVDEGVDLLNIDDPEGCASFWEGKG